MGSHGHSHSASRRPRPHLTPGASKPRLRIPRPEVFFLTSLLEESSVSLSSRREVFEFTLTCCHPLPLIFHHLLRPVDPPFPSGPCLFPSVPPLWCWLSASQPPVHWNSPACALGTCFHISFLPCEMTSPPRAGTP